MDELTPVLQRFSVEVVEASRQVSRDAIVYCMNTVIQPIISSIGRADARFKCYVPLPTEQYFEAMKVSACDEFELIVVLDNLVHMKSFRDLSETNPNLSCYGEVMFAQSFANDMWAADLCVPVRQGPHSFLSATKIRQNFAKLVALIAADIFHNGMVQVSYKDPYTEVRICRHADERYVFQLVPALYFHEPWPPCTAGFGVPDKMTSWLTPEVAACCRHLGYFALPLPCPYSAEESLWRLSFLRAEKYLLGPDHRYLLGHREKATLPCSGGGVGDAAVAAQRVRKQVERIVKMLRTSDPDSFRPLSSYHLKTVMLHVCHQQSPDSALWVTSRLGERLLEVLRYLIVSLEKGSLPHFFVPACNLLAHYGHQELQAAAHRLRDIHDELCNSPAHSIRLQC
ncbi:cyclic GMP-AMP synthase-like receptor 1 [Babylonia areolata]|uniref:cyclic GMP-AMP synthase-like receptor 1 n=1 Tax=Babylonia areolata TaxID=304850 RepID=UPI003FD1ED11